MAYVLRGSNLDPVSKPAMNGNARCREAHGTAYLPQTLHVRQVLTLPKNQILLVAQITQGTCICFKLHPDGSRTVIDVLLSGNLISSDYLELSNSSVMALTSSQYVLRELDSESTSPYLPIGYHEVFQACVRRQARLAERIASIGRRGALERTGHLFLELAARMNASITDNQCRFDCALRQADIGDSLGLTSVHVSRVLKEMRLRGLVQMRNGTVRLLDIARLREITGFDSEY